MVSTVSGKVSTNPLQHPYRRVNNDTIEHDVAFVFVKCDYTPRIAKGANADQRRDCQMQEDISPQHRG